MASNRSSSIGNPSCRYFWLGRAAQVGPAKWRRWPVPVAVALALGQSMISVPSFAAVDASPDETPSDSGMLSEIVVTATRRSENQQSVPIAINTFQGEALRSAGIESTIDLPQLTPGLQVTRTLVGANLFLRGVGTTSAGYSTESPIATYVDGLYLPNSAAAAFSFNNIERIEVLKGPQGTLYGRNTTGGLINVITREPDPTPTVDVSVGHANFNTTTTNFYGSAPINDTLAGNVAVTYTNQADGWYRNEFLGVDAFTFRDLGAQSKLRWTPAPGTRITLRAFFDRISTDQGNNASIYPGSFGIDGTPYLGEGNFATRIPAFATQKQGAVSLKAEQDFKFATLTSITGYINNSSDSGQVQNAIAGQPVIGQSAVNLDGYQAAKTISQELQLASSDDEAVFKWITGAFYWHDNTTINLHVFGTCVDLVCAAAPVPTNQTGVPKTVSYSAYGEGTYNILPTTHFTLGLRYTRDHKTLDGFAAPLPGFPNSLPAFPPSVVTRPGQPYPGNPNGIDTDITYSKPTWKAALAQDFGQDVHGYLTYNRGFKSGGYNPSSFTNPPSRPEVLDAVEAGIKSELFDRVLRVNASAFYYDYKDIQLRSTAPPAPPGGTVLLNAAAAHMKGIDLDFALAPIKNFVINGGAEYLDARYVDFPGGYCIDPRPIGGRVLGGTITVPCDVLGKRPPSAPVFSYSLSATYTMNSPVGPIDLTASDGFKSSFFWEVDNRLKQNAFHLVDASLTWSSPDTHYSIQLFGRNLGDKYYFVSGAEGAAGDDIYTPGQPRTYGVNLRYRL